MATKHTSQTDIPLLHQVIPVIDTLTGMLEDVIESDKTMDMVRVAAARGLAVLNKYYSKTDESVMHRVAMSKFFYCNR